ncbi:tetratricopeptide repeat protein [Hyalangium minutum]|uniref:Uncharacterized protein n=1 Tax=Hyalangium minutum TaxID=394096 RepID=A0A085WNF9_9BACT|nr:tetratricopeptide repeat protein [Hyalangium minutum]KFE69222.1 hypothetical protein DB31_7124 [Hyalangium minutum]
MSQDSHEHEEPFDLLGPLDERSGPAQRISQKRSAELIQGVLAVMEAPAAPPPKRGRFRRGVWVTGACLVLAGAAAASYWSLRTSPPEVLPVPRVAEVQPPVAPAPQAVQPAPEPAVPPPPPSAPTEPAVAPAQEPVVRQRPAAPATEPEDLLRRANERRAAGAWREADALYQRVIQSHPGTASAYVARVASAELRLKQLGDAQGALRQFQQALRMQPHGTLSEEARHGVAEAFQALGDPVREAQALKDFLQAHPESLLAEPARRRLQALSPPAP